MRRSLILFLNSLLAIAAILLAIRLLAGPFHSPLLSVNSPVNACALVAVAFVLLALIAAQHPVSLPPQPPRPSMAATLFLVAALAIAFSPNLRSPFVYDDYTHILQSSHATWRILLNAFAPVHGARGLFFRPVGFISYWLDYQWAGRHVSRWHLWSIAAHAVNTCLVYGLITRFGIHRAPAFIGALLFALHGSRAETVAWSDARFDLLAAFFALCAVLAALRYCQTGRRVLYVPLALCAALAVCAKESAFCLPLLPLALLPALPRTQWRRAAAASLALAAICAGVFAYRWWALGGIGGYVDRSGVSAVWHSRPLHTTEALLFRQWAFLFFPVNWSLPLEWWLRLAACAFLAALPLTVRGAPSRAPLWAGLAFLLAAVIPVQHILMFQPDFAGARVLYLPLAGLAVFWAALLDRSPRSRLTWAMAAALIAFNVAALEHNLAPWRTTPAAATAVCSAFGRDMAKDPRPVFVVGLPDRLRGVYFLSNGFPECVEMNSGQAASRVHLAQSAGELPPATRTFVWNQDRGRLEERR